VKSCRAYVFLLQVFSALIKIVVFVTTFISMLFILFCCFFPEKMVIQKTEKEYYSLFLLKINPKSLHLLILLKIIHKSCAD